MMENMEGNEKKSSFSWVWWLIFLILACTLTGFIVHNNGPKIDSFFGFKNPEDAQKNIVQEDTAVHVTTIQEVLSFREHIRECNRIDSVFLTIPDVCLIDILANHGTELSNADIVYIYENNPDTYNAVQSGARSQQYKEQLEHKQIEPDTIPKKGIPDQPILN